MPIDFTAPAPHSAGRVLRPEGGPIAIRANLPRMYHVE